MKIEFRWFPVGIWDGRDHVTVDDRPHVLQFRHTEKVTDPDQESAFLIQWTDWQDVTRASGD